MECAHQHEYVLAFDVVPVKGSRKDQVKVVDVNQESGTMSAVVWCKEHAPKNPSQFHLMNEPVGDTGLTALQLYAHTYKQADPALTGTARKATLVNQLLKALGSVVSSTANNRRTSTAASTNGNGKVSASVKADEAGTGDHSTSDDHLHNANICATCSVDVSPKWWPLHLNGVSTTIAPVPATEETGLKHQILVDGVIPMDVDTEPNAETVDSTKPKASHTADGYQESNDGHAALAAAALLKDPLDETVEAPNVQCNKCHWNKIKQPTLPPSPTPEAVPAEPMAAEMPIPSTVPLPPAANIHNVPMAEAHPVQAHAANHYAWPRPPVYSPMQWPHPPPPPQNGGPGHSYQDPRMTNGHVQHGPPNGVLQHSPSNWPPREGISRSPHLSQQIPNSWPQRDGGPHGPHPSQQGPSSWPSNAIHGHPSNHMGWPPSQPPMGPQHLVSGGAPPRASESPFTQPAHASANHMAANMVNNGSPNLTRERPPTPSAGNPVNGVRGGASASPSLRNLLS